ncbi:hypothetical protein N7491_006879 [Penicillium cf. griseofulvum]|uniref:Uncharacterized protein n=1 Tax=Penicillium cf. griseofulvum TaxID=2972120 RepID=A0A9W9J0G5_9EURO|nr:hypothetical protein N7472_010091 [Penicillium cf. griseofulvum]KAJ5429863.1 hypothetical protein N7491_006879 [Penicillium cf. griseofulvum]KAJ5436367.1 hypothetical protein N7445_007252 [Penicillium cf. griseofulvum]
MAARERVAKELQKAVSDTAAGFGAGAESSALLSTSKPTISSPSTDQEAVALVEHLLDILNERADGNRIASEMRLIQ